jgi:hypothetical protein
MSGMDVIAAYRDGYESGQRDERERLTDRIVELWNNMSPGGGWIPGAAYKELAEVLGVDPDRLVHYDIENHRRHIPEEGREDL